MSMRRSLLLVLTTFLLLPAGPAHASHDDYGPGVVVLSDRPAVAGRVTVVFAADVDEAAAVREVRAAAAEAGLEIQDVRAAKNTDPDTVRVLASTVLGERSGFLERTVPRERLAAWDRFADGPLLLSLPPRAVAEGRRPEPGGDYLLTAEGSDVPYRLPSAALWVPLLLLVAAAVVPYVVARTHAAAVTRCGGDVRDQLHRIRRAAVVVQLATPLVLLGALFTTGSSQWSSLAVSEALGGAVLARPVAVIVGVAGFVVPAALAVVAGTVAVLPYDRRLRATEQTRRAGAGQALRVLGLGMIPALLWVVLLAVVPGGGWTRLPLLVAFLATLTVLQPLLLNVVLTTRPLDPALRERVLAACAEQGLRVRDARLIDSRGGKVANAAISGVLPSLRYVYLTDHLLDVMEPDELRAVLAHEIAHGRGHHLLLKLLAGLGALGSLSLVLATVGQRPFVALLDALGPLVLVLGMPVLLVTVVLLTQGVVGVALEKRADDQAVETVGAAPLARALGKLADANGLKRRTGWWWNVLQQHPGMDQRLRRLGVPSGVDDQGGRPDRAPESRLTG